MKIEVIVHPNAKNPRIETDLLGTLHIFVQAPPLEGKANRAVIEALAEHFKIKRNKIEMVSGSKSKSKVFQIFP